MVLERGYTQIARFMGPTWGAPGDGRTQVGPMMAPWNLLSGYIFKIVNTRYPIGTFKSPPRKLCLVYLMHYTEFLYWFWKKIYTLGLGKQTQIKVYFIMCIFPVYLGDDCLQSNTIPGHLYLSHHDDVIKWKLFPRYWPFVPVTRSYDVFFVLHPNKWLSKQWWVWWLETPPCPLRRHSNVISAVARSNDTGLWLVIPDYMNPGYFTLPAIDLRP